MFLVWKGEAIERLEPKFFLRKYRVSDERINNSKFDKYYLKQISELISDGTHFTPSYTEEGVKFLSVKDVRQFEITYDRSKYISLAEAEILDKRCKPQKGDVLLTKIGATFGYASVVNSDERFQIFVSLALLRTKDEILLPEFLALYLNTNNNYLQFERVIKGAGVPDLHLEDIRKVKIPVPPIEVQKQIVENFENAYAEKKAKEAEAREKLASVDRLVLDALGITLPEREENTLAKRIFFTKSSDISSERFDVSYRRPRHTKVLKAIQSGKFGVIQFREILLDLKNGIESREYSDSGFRYLRVTDLGKFELNNKSPRYVEIDEIPPRIKLSTDCLLISRSGSLGLVSVVTNEMLEIILSSHIFKAQIDTSKVSTKFLETYFRSVLGQEQFFRNNNGGVIPEISQTALRHLLIVLPPPEVQAEIAERVEAIYAEAKKLQADGKEILEKAKAEVERMILGDDSTSGSESKR